MSWKGWRRVRQGSQVVFLAGAVVLLFAGLRGRPAFAFADAFFRLDPLAGLAGMLSARAWLPELGLGLAVLGLTLVLGRFWCGWICPMGTLVEWISPRRARRRTKPLSPRWRWVKQGLLAAILAGALLGSLSLLVFDPLALFTRGMTVVVIPALDRAITALETTLYAARWLRPVVDWMETALRGPVLPAERAVFEGSLWVALLLAGLLALNGLAERFWCRYLCPLGGLLGLVSRLALLRPKVSGQCRACGKCARACPMDAIDEADGYRVDTGECVMCLDCLAGCPQEEMGLAWGRPAAKTPDPGLISRRQALGALALGAAGVLLAEVDVRAKQPDGLLVRPPGAQDEGAFLARCVRCGLCIRTCPTTGLQPSALEGGLSGVWTPRLVSRLGACDYACTACGEVCPSGAIPALDLATKRETVIGLAAVDRNRCLPWAYDTPCIVCEEMCPRPSKAIRVEEVPVKDAGGFDVLLKRPYVLRDLCIGCGICEQQCPLAGEAAIRVYRRA